MSPSIGKKGKLKGEGMKRKNKVLTLTALTLALLLPVSQAEAASEDLQAPVESVESTLDASVEEAAATTVEVQRLLLTR